MPKVISYAVLLINRELDKKNAGMLKNLEPQLVNLFYKYQMEMMAITKEEGIYFDVVSAYENNNIDTLCIAADKEYNVYGFIILEADMITRTLWTSHVFVDPSVRMSGVYKLMMKRVKKFAEDAKFNRIFSLVHRNNYGSRQAHRKVFGPQMWNGYQMEIKHEDK